MGIVKFGDCVLDMDARRLFRSGQPVHLSPKAYELLKILVYEQPRAIPKAELHDRIWPGTFVSDDSLTRLAAEARAAIGDAPRTPVFLRTVHAFGYAFSNGAEAGGDTASRSEQPHFWVIQEGRATPLSEGANVIGRDPAVRIMLDSIRVSRRHAQITVGGWSATLDDLGSRNGTFLNGAPVRNQVGLADGDEIGIGSVALSFRAAGAAAPTEADE